ncbi:MAG: beta-ketoacyl synthase N-terminal-like domain-containing protein [Flavobacteriaceae bacterium]
MLKEPIYITALSSVSSLGSTEEEVWDSYRGDHHCLTKEEIGGETVWTSRLGKIIRGAIDTLRDSNEKYHHLDDTVLFAMYASRNAIQTAGWQSDTNFGINLGSSRGATGLFERYHREFLGNQRTSTLTSPTTTLGNISSWVAHDLGAKGPIVSHSITCSTALHALLNGVAWLQSGMAAKFLIGGSEAPLTPFTLAQMRALKIYALPKGTDRPALSVAEMSRSHPCKALDLQKKENTMVLGEGAAVACLEREASGKKAMAKIIGVGYASELLRHHVSISADGQCFQDSMKMALGGVSPAEVDVVVMHAPGTVKGDLSEYKAVEKLFGNAMPALTTNKWKVGHTFGASGLLSVELAVLMLQHQYFVPTPFFEQAPPGKIQKVMVNAVGFGGNAVSVLLSV